MFGDVLTRFGFYSPVFVTEHSGDNLSDLLSLKYGHTFCPNLWEVNFLFVLFLDNCFQLRRLGFSVAEWNAVGWHLLAPTASPGQYQYGPDWHHAMLGQATLGPVNPSHGKAGGGEGVRHCHSHFYHFTIFAPHFSVLGNTWQY